MTEHLFAGRRGGPQVIVAGSEREFAVLAADKVQREIRGRADCVLAVPTGNTPTTMYAELSQRCRDGELSFAEVRTFNLDEFVGLPGDHRASFETYMMQNFFTHIDIDMANVHIPNGHAANLEQACVEFERNIAAVGGFDLAVMGIGANGHIAFNEPGTSFDSRTHVVTLSEGSREAHASAFGGLQRVPLEGVTMGIATLLGARRIVLLAKGADKADIVAHALQGPVTAEVPASALQRHQNVTFILDQPAASQLVGGQ